MRAELFSVSQLERHARTMAGWHEVARGRRDDRLLARLEENATVLRDAYELVTEAVQRGREITPAAEWFIDNYHLVEEQIRTTRQHLPRSYDRELPRLTNAPSAGSPRVYDIALELISHADGRLDGESLRAFVAAYQTVEPLLLGELWAIPIMLRLALLENMRRVVAAVTAGRRDRERAAVWVDAMSDAAASEHAEVVVALADMVRESPALTSAFVAELATRLHRRGAAVSIAMTWLEQRLAAEGKTVDHVFQQVSQSQAADQVSIGNSIGSLRTLTALDWRDFVEGASVVERALLRDPAGVYGDMTFATRDAYRHVVEEIARGSDAGEEDVALAAIDLAADPSSAEAAARHVGSFLHGAGRRDLERVVAYRPPVVQHVRRVLRATRGLVYASSIAAITTAAAWVLSRAVPAPLHGAAAVLWWSVLTLAASHLAVALVQLAATLLVPPRLLPRLDFSAGIPDQHRTLVAVPVLLAHDDEIDALVEALEVRFLANRDKNLVFALVTDLRDAEAEVEDADASLLARARRGIEALNEAHAARGGAFFLLHRARRWNPREGVWMGWERKRGKLEDLNAALRGEEGRFQVVVGPPAELEGIRSVIVLDGDTALPRDAARLLAGTLGHPANRPVMDAARGRVTSGYAILQPRVGVSMASSARSRFAQLHGGEPGIDPYTRAVSDLYQDVFDEGSFVGKGIYDVDAMRAALAGKLPENRVLSHDLLEGAYARSGVVSDVLLVEDHPAAHSADVTRRRRWIRGDWQIAAWLLPWAPGPDGRARNPITALARWKILDNLRRSLVAPALLGFLLGGWALPGAAVPATIATVLLLAIPGLVTAAAALVRRPDQTQPAPHAREVARALVRQLAREGLALAWLPQEAALALGAIARTGARLLTGRHLLEWRTASEAQRAARGGIASAYADMSGGPLLALAALALLTRARSPGLACAAPVLVLWLVGPALSWWLSRPRSETAAALDVAQARFLRRVARRTWQFFETFVTAEHHHLPPDNVQEDPPRGSAPRTSPTNIGMSMVATLAAHDFGYLTAGQVASRTALTLDTLDRMERHRSHFYNWYDTTTLQPLPPLYVSTVDSGNLAAHLLVLAAGLEELLGRGAHRPEIFAGLADTLDLLEEGDAESSANADALAILRGALTEAQAASPSSRALHEALADLGAQAARLADHGTTGTPGAGTPIATDWAKALVAQARAADEELTFLAPWLLIDPEAPSTSDPRLDAVMTLEETARLDADATTWDASTEVRAAIALAAERARGRVAELRGLASRCRVLADLEVDFLYDPDRHLLSIGYNASERRLDAGFYDLLASEARLASFVAIAHGKVPQEHWFRLGRSLTTAGGRPALLSWSGSMFEYLMPLLVMPTWRGTLLDDTYRSVVAQQIAYGAERGVAWGISESGYAKTDAQLNYQYRAFGVPGLGYKRGLGEDLVIAPYASAMALMVAPAAACANLERLAAEGELGEHGFYEAIDHTPLRVPAGATHVTVRSYMAHHQGMAFLSLAYVLLDRPMQRRFAADPALRATELLLQERVPRTASVDPHPAETSIPMVPAEPEADLRVFTTPDTATPEVHLLSNGSYHVAITNAGGGSSRWRDLAVTRWHEDATRDCWGSFGYLRDVGSARFWSIAHQPTLVRASHYEAIHTQGRAEFRRHDDDIETHVEIAVSPEDDVELRRVSLTNRGKTERVIELTTYAEVVLTQPAADAAHASFSNLFVQTEIVRAAEAILCTRRPRSGGDAPPWMMHAVTLVGRESGQASYETARVAFLGRKRSVVDPIVMYRDALGDGEGSVLDPIVAIRRRVILAPDETARLHVFTGVAETRQGALDLVDKHRDRHAAERLLELSHTHSQVDRKRIDASHADALVYQRLANHVIYGNSTLRAPRSVLARNRGGQSGLWAYGISGDLPIVLVRVADVSEIGLVRQVVKCHAYLRIKGLASDLVVWNEDPSAYRQALQDEIMAVVSSVADGTPLDRPGGIFVRRSEQISEDDRVLLQTVARVVLTGSAGTLAEQIDREPPAETRPPRLVELAEPAPLQRAPSVETVDGRPDLACFNGLGGFTQDGREYVITSTRDGATPTPWVNVIANPWFGTVVSESGGAYTWCENAHSHRLTPWSGDAVGDVSGEALYVRDDEDGRHWSPTPLPAGPAAPITSRHGFGYSIFEAEDESGIASEMKTYVAIDAPLKFVVLTLKNRSGRSRHLSVTAVFDLCLGASRAANAPHVVTEIDPRTSGFFARNAYSADFAARVAFLDCSVEKRSVSGDRVEVFGRNGTPARPACLERARLSGRVGAGLDPCLAMQVGVDLADGQEREVVFTFGSGRDLADARHLVQRFRGTGPAQAALEAVWEHWKQTLGAVQVTTPDRTLDFLANGWLTYQVIACRLWGRSGFYQSGGAYGFRDQLQDAMALVHAQPALLREQILRAAARQFAEGDVQHWWHPPQGRGVRTHISDDYLWLPYAVCRYVTAVGDTGVLDEVIHFIEGRAVGEGEDSVYDLHPRSEESATLYEHCQRAILHGLRFGAHGLPLMGSGDWNDGMNLVGELGRGESVWLGFFLHDVLARFAELARRRDDVPFAERCTAATTALRASLEEHGWDGEWYRRAYFDDGSPLGSATSPECQIDSLPQSWSVLSGAGDPVRSRRALQAVDERLVRRDLGVIRLFDPPFDTSDLKPGYVKGYVPGVRENGGQYTHAAVWTAMAFAKAGDVKRAWELFGMINPVRHGDSPEAIATYKVEPYVVAADVYTNPQHAGRGGWTWYTGSAAWMLRLITESLLGLRLEVDVLRVEPLLPADWEGFDVRYRHRSTTYEILVRRRGEGTAVRRVVCDEVEQEDRAIHLRDDGHLHHVTVEIGPGPPLLA